MHAYMDGVLASTHVLPATGLAPETFLWAGIGVAVLVIGGVLVVLSRRRSKDD